MLALLSLLVGTAFAADCPEPTTVAAIEGHLQTAEAAYGKLDVPGFSAAMDEAAFALPCLGEWVTPQLAANYHRLQGLALFTAKDEERAVQSFAAARATDSTTAAIGDLVPEGHVLHDLHARQEIGTPRTETLPTPIDAVLRVDGAETLERPKDWPAIVQIRSEASGTTTAYLFPRDALPSYAAEAPIEPTTVATKGGPRRFPAVPLLIGGGVALGASATLYGLAGSSGSRLNTYDPTRTQADLDKIKATTNGMVAGSIVTGLAGLGAAGVGGLGIAGIF